MPHYRYRATDANGTVVKAKADSRNERELREALLLQNLDVTDIKEHQRLGDIELGKKRIPPMEIMQFSRQMATFVRAGISIPEGLDVIIESTSSKRFADILREVSEAIVRGVPFSDALAEHARSCRRTTSASAAQESSPVASTPCSNSSPSTSSVISTHVRR